MHERDRQTCRWTDGHRATAKTALTQRTGEQLKWSLAFSLYIGSWFHVHSYQDQFIQPGRVCFLVYLA